MIEPYSSVALLLLRFNLAFGNKVRRSTLGSDYGLYKVL